MVQDGVLLDGRNRLVACEKAGIAPVFREYKGESPVAFIIGVNLKRRHLTMGQKVALGLEIEPYFAKEAKKRMQAGIKPDPEAKVPQGRKPQSRDQAAKSVGLSGKTITNAKDIKKNAPDLFEKVKTGAMTVAAARKAMKARRDQEELTAAQKRITDSRRRKLESVCELRVCSCRALFESGLKPDAVITDPPYSKEFLAVFTELAEATRNVPLVAVMAGQSYLPEILRRLCEHLTYRWTLAYLTPGGQSAQQWKSKVNAGWKPIFLFGKSLDWFGDVVNSEVNDNDKRFHKWGQSESGMADLVDRLTRPGQLICDPFLGGGSTAVSALALGRRFVGCDVDKKAVDQTRRRLEGRKDA